MRKAFALHFSLLFGLLFSLASVCHADEAAGQRTAFDHYIAKPDSAYEWKLASSQKGDGYTTYVVDMVSQTWRKKSEVDRIVWQHYLTIVKPDNVKYNTGFLMIGGGRNGGRAPSRSDRRTIQIAKSTNSVVATLGMTPNQPLEFFKDGKKRVEDDLIAYCWVKYMETGDPEWLPRFPMVKGAVRAMDTITALLKSEEGGGITVDKFVVAGGSKRGWTTWMTGVADQPRVVAIVPIVIDVVNVKECSANHYSAYGFWAPAIGDYEEHGLVQRREDPEYQKLLELVDPYYYIDRLKLPKYVVNASGDQFFPPDSSKFYYHDLKGPKWLRYVPNANHGLGGSDAIESIISFYQAILDKREMPKYTWEVLENGSIKVVSEVEPKEVNLWQATNPKARDFRLEKIGRAYKKSTISGQGNGVYIASVPKPEKGFTAFFIEMVYESGSATPFKFTSGVHIVPDVLPFSYDEYIKKIKAEKANK